MLHDRERAAIDGLWTVKISQDARDVPQAQRCRNLEPDSAEFICALAAGCGATSILEIGGSSGISTIALAAAARRTNGRLVSIEIEPARLAPGAVVVADNILSHDLRDYVRHVRAVPGIQSMTLPVGKGLEVSRMGGDPDSRR